MTASTSDTRTTRRAVITAGLGGAAALAAQALIRPAPVAAGSDGDVVLGEGNYAETMTSVEMGYGSGEPAAFMGVGSDTAGLFGSTDSTDTGGVIGYGEVGAGLLGVGTTGSVAIGDVGVYATGGVGILGDAYTGDTAIYGFVGPTDPPPPQADVAIHARAAGSGVALRVDGKVQMNRSGRISVAAGKTSIAKSISGVTTSSIVIAVLQTVESGTWVRAAVPAAGKITVYFNRALPTSSVVGYMILN
jgi:hypothetical protein